LFYCLCASLIAWEALFFQVKLTNVAVSSVWRLVFIFYFYFSKNKRCRPGIVDGAIFLGRGTIYINTSEDKSRYVCLQYIGFNTDLIYKVIHVAR
jgi:hypothetical protein